MHQSLDIIKYTFQHFNTDQVILLSLSDQHAESTTPTTPLLSVMSETILRNVFRERGRSYSTTPEMQERAAVTYHPKFLQLVYMLTNYFNPKRMTYFWTA